MAVAFLGPRRRGLRHCRQIPNPACDRASRPISCGAYPGASCRRVGSPRRRQHHPALCTAGNMGNCRASISIKPACGLGLLRVRCRRFRTDQRLAGRRGPAGEGARQGGEAKRAQKSEFRGVRPCLILIFQIRKRPPQRARARKDFASVVAVRRAGGKGRAIGRRPQEILRAVERLRRQKQRHAAFSGPGGTPSMGFKF